jgi:hypothetical protein
MMPPIVTRALKAAVVLVAAAALYLAALIYGSMGYQLGYEDGSRSCDNDGSSAY